MNKQIEQKLLQARRLIDEALAAAGSDASRVHVDLSTNAQTLAELKTLGDHIMALRESGFFKEPRTQNESYDKVHEVYFCERKRVGVELFRLYKKRQLRKVSKEVEGRKLVAYVW